MGSRYKESIYGYKKATRSHYRHDYDDDEDEFDINRVGLSSHS